MEVFAGIRYTNDEKAVDEYNNFVGTLIQDDSWSEVTYELGTSYDFSDEITGYAKYSTGFKSGGFGLGSLGPGFEPESNKNFELDLKGNYLDSSLQLILIAIQLLTLRRKHPVPF